jgi:hypothetical protein
MVWLPEEGQPMLRRLILLYSVVVILCLGVSELAGARIDPGSVVGLWVFDADGDMEDISGKGHDGAIEGNVEWVAGKFGLAVEVDGASAVIVEHADDMNLESFSLLAWVNIPVAPTDWWTIAAKDGWPDRNYGIWLASGTGLAHHSFTSGTAPDNNAINAVTPVTPGEWYHVAATYDMSSSKLYINGELDAEAAFSVTPNVTDVPFIVGRTDNGSYKLQGAVDELALFSVALSDADIETIMTGGLRATVAAVSPSAKLATTWAGIKSAAF